MPVNQETRPSARRGGVVRRRFRQHDGMPFGSAKLCLQSDAPALLDDPVRAGFYVRAMLGLGRDTGEAEVVAEFADEARAARKIIEEELGLGPTRNNEVMFDTDLDRVRAKLKAMRGLARSDDDKSVHLLLTLLVVKDKERYQTVFMSRRKDIPYGKYDSAITALYKQREVCAAELRDWLDAGSSDPSSLRDAPCMTEAREAAALAGVG